MDGGGEGHIICKEITLILIVKVLDYRVADEDAMKDQIYVLPEEWITKPPFHAQKLVIEGKWKILHTKYMYYRSLYKK